MLAAITGASGHIGVNLARELTARGDRVRALSHCSNLGLEALGAEYCKGDICLPQSLDTCFKEAEIVYHLAAHITLRMNDWKRCAAINIEGTRNVIDACRRAGVRRLVHFSSIHAFMDVPPGAVIDESCPLQESAKAPPYDRSKAVGELLVQDAVDRGMDAIIISPTAVIGPFDYRPSHFGQALILIASGRMPVLIDGGFDWVDARDVARWSIEAASRAGRGAKYILSGQWLSMSEITAFSAEVMGFRPPAVTCPLPLARACSPLVMAASDMAGTRPIFTSVSLDTLGNYRNISHARASAEIGYSPRPVRETLLATINWFCDQGYLKKSARSKRQ